MTKSNTNHQKRILLIGGYPKGYDVPFHPSTVSGSRLRKLVQKHNLDAEFMDIWDNERQEQEGILVLNRMAEIEQFLHSGYRVIALGKRVYNAIIKVDNEFHKTISDKIEYLPHPASRRKIDLQRLESGLTQ